MTSTPARTSGRRGSKCPCVSETTPIFMDALQVLATHQAEGGRVQSILFGRRTFCLPACLAHYLFDPLLGGSALRTHFVAIGEAQLTAAGAGNRVQPEDGEIFFSRGERLQSRVRNGGKIRGDEI